LRIGNKQENNKETSENRETKKKLQNISTPTKQ